MKRVVLFSLVLGLVSASFAQEGGTPSSVWMYVGSTWWDLQTNGTPGRMIAVGPSGGVHFVWTQSNESATYRQAYYNCWDTESGTLLSVNGTQTGGETRSGFPVVLVDQFGFALPVYHVNGPEATSVRVVADFLPCVGAFQMNDSTFPDLSRITIYAKSDIDMLGRLHIVGTVDDFNPRGFYRRGLPFDPDGLGWWMVWDLPLFGPQLLA